MTVAEFKKKWLRYHGKETSAYQEHFNDLCRLLGQPTPAEADPTGSDWFCFQKRVVKDLELFAVEPDGAEAPKEKRGFADVWRKDAFAWEYKGKHKDLDEAYRQLQRYRESLLNPPLLVVCDFERFIIRTNFNGTVQFRQRALRRIKPGFRDCRSCRSGFTPRSIRAGDMHKAIGAAHGAGPRPETDRRRRAIKRKF
jgi:hypothetical protein